MYSILEIRPVHPLRPKMPTLAEFHYWISRMNLFVWPFIDCIPRAEFQETEEWIARHPVRITGLPFLIQAVAERRFERPAVVLRQSVCEGRRRCPASW